MQETQASRGSIQLIGCRHLPGGGSRRAESTGLWTRGLGWGPAALFNLHAFSELLLISSRPLELKFRPFGRGPKLNQAISFQKHWLQGLEEDLYGLAIASIAAGLLRGLNSRGVL